MATKKNVKKENKLSASTKLIIIICSLSTICIIFALYQVSIKGDTVMLAIPQVQSTIVSDEDGEVHNVTMYFTLEVDKKTSKKIDVNEINAIISDTISTLNYDYILGEYSVDYVHDAVYNELMKNYSPEEITDIYITGIYNDGYEPPKK